MITSGKGRLLRALWSITGPGEYDPKNAPGWKADPKSGFLGNERFNELQREGVLGGCSRLKTAVPDILCVAVHTASRQAFDLLMERVLIGCYCFQTAKIFPSSCRLPRTAEPALRRRGASIRGPRSVLRSLNRKSTASSAKARYRPQAHRLDALAMPLSTSI